ncbi:diacylglycerol/lipid kinase family protein [Thalassiella azotivora]
MTQIPVERGADPRRPQVLAVVNPGAGSAREEDVATAVVALREQADVEVVTPADEAELDAALSVRGDRRLVVLGGDGTLHDVANALHRAGRLGDVGPVGVVPLGTGNDLATGLGVPADPALAARIALTGRPREVEVLVDEDGGVVVNAVHAGVGAEAAQRAEGSKAALGATAYKVGALAAGVAASGRHLRVVVDGHEVHDGSEPVLMAAVVVGRTVGGGAPVAPGSQPTDGYAEVVVSLATGLGARVGFARDVLSGAHTDRDDVIVARGCEVLVAAADGEPFPLDVDGEVEAEVVRRTWRVVPRAWSLVVPS